MPNKKFRIFDSDALKNIHQRVFFSIVVFIIFYSLVFFQIYNIMIFSKYFNGELLKKNIQIKQTENRGEIFDRNGVLLASTIKSYSLFARPKKIKEIDSLSKKLEEILSIPQNEIKSKLSKDTNFVWIKRNIIPREHQEIINLGEIGLQTKPENKRVYPHRELTSHIVGFDNIDGKGLSGIEKGLQNKLDSGENINLSVDIRIQNSVRNELIKTIQKFSAQSGSAIVMNITTGEILSMVNYPDFDPNFRDKILTKNQFNNATQGVFEMGSTFKPITMAIALDKNIVDLEMLFDVSQPIKLGKYIINDFTSYKGKLNVKGIIVKSSNIGAAKIAQLIGKKNQIEYFKKFGFFDEIDLELDETQKPLFPNHWKEIETMTMGYGHGFAVTPLHLCQAYASMVNGGFMVKSTLLKNNNQAISDRVINSSTSDQIKSLLRSVILETKYTGPNARIAGYELGGKTGTAELLINGHYSSHANLASFISVFPISNPKYLVFAMVIGPKKIEETYFNNTGGWVAAPLVKDIILEMIKILGIPPRSNTNKLKASNDRYPVMNSNVTL